MIQCKVLFIHSSGICIILFKFPNSTELHQPPFPFHKICHCTQHVTKTLQQLPFTKVGHYKGSDPLKNYFGFFIKPCKNGFKKMQNKSKTHYCFRPIKAHCINGARMYLTISVVYSYTRTDAPLTLFFIGRISE